MAIATTGLDKFRDVFTSMNRNIATQTSMIESLLIVNQDIFAVEKERLNDEARRLRLAELEDTFNKKPTQGDPNGPITANDPMHRDQKRAEADDKQAKSFWDAALPGIGTFFGSLFAGRHIPMIVRGGLWGTIALAFGKEIETFATDFFSTTLKDLGAGDEFSKNFSEGLGNATHWGLFGMILGKKFAAALAIGSFFEKDLKLLVGTIFDSNKNGMIEAFGKEIVSVDLAGQVGVVLAGLFAWKTIAPIVSAAFWGKEGTLLPALKKRLIGSFMGRASIGLLMYKLGGWLGDAVEEATGSEALGEAVTSAANGAAIGFTLAGPWGALIGAVVGLAYTGLKKIAGWLRNQDDKIAAAMDSKLKGLEVDPAKLMTEEGRLDLAMIKQENDRTLEKALNEAERASADETKRRILDLTGKNSPNAKLAWGSEVLTNFQATGASDEQVSSYAAQLLKDARDMHNESNPDKLIDLNTEAGLRKATQLIITAAEASEKNILNKFDNKETMLQSLQDALNLVKIGKFEKNIDLLERRINGAESAVLDGTWRRGAGAVNLLSAPSSGPVTNNTDNSNRSQTVIMPPSRYLDHAYLPY